jgi:hypothetical protein
LEGKAYLNRDTQSAAESGKEPQLDFHVHAPKVFFMRSEQMPVRPERGWGLRLAPAPLLDLFPGERWIENEGTTGALFLERSALNVPF